MKPISIKIEAYGPYSAEQTAEAFQKHCFSKGVNWTVYREYVQYRDEDVFSIDVGEITKELRLFVGINCPLDYHPLTLPTDWKAFKTYLDEYIAFHQKSEPQAGKHYQNSYSKEIFKILEVRDGGELLIAYSDGVPKLNDLEQLGPPATPSEVAQYEKTRKETALLEEARKRYPKGTKFKSALFDTIGVSLAKFHTDAAGSVLTKAEDGYTLYVYDKGQWAEIIKEETPEEKPTKSIKDMLQDVIDSNTSIPFDLAGSIYELHKEFISPWKEETQEPTEQKPYSVVKVYPAQKELAENKKLRRRLIAKRERINKLEEALKNILAWNWGRYGSDYQKDLDKAKDLLKK